MRAYSNGYHGRPTVPRCSALVAALLGLARGGFRARLLGLCLLDGNLALRSRLFLLRLTLATKLVLARQRAGRLLDLAVHVFGNALPARLRSAVFRVIAHLLFPSHSLFRDRVVGCYPGLRPR